MCATLFLSLLASDLAQTTPAGWKIVKDSKGVCQIAVPPELARLMRSDPN
jgi:hypothetical protein